MHYSELVYAALPSASAGCTVASLCRLHYSGVMQAAPLKCRLHSAFFSEVQAALLLYSLHSYKEVSVARRPRSQRRETIKKRKTLTGFANAAAKKVLLEIDADAEVLVPT